MKDRFRITRRGSRGGAFYCVDTQTKKRTSLKTADLKTARRIVQAKNEAEQQPALNLQLAKAYLAGTDSEVNRRTWHEALITLTNLKKGSNKERWERAAKDKAFAPLLPRVPTIRPESSKFPLDGRAEGALPSPILGRSILRGRDAASLLSWQARADHIPP